MSENVSFNEFSPTTYEEWLKKLEHDLKGAELNSFLHKNSRKNLNLSINYNTVDVPHGVNSSTKNIPAFFKPNGWFIEQLILAVSGEEKRQNKELLLLLENGCSAVRVQVSEEINWKVLLDKVDLDLIQFSIEDFSPNQKSAETFIAQYSNAYHFSVLPHFVEQKAVLHANEIDTSYFANQGALPQQQIALGLLQLHESIETSPQKTLRVNVACDSEVLLEIAKLRAFRYCAHKILEAFSSKTKLRFAAEPMYLNYSHKDPENNILRASATCFTAALAGCEIICTFPHNSSFSAYRTAQNCQLLAQEEAHLDENYDALKGSSVIEGFSKTIAESAWNEFLKLREKGSFSQLLSNGEISAYVTDAQKSLHNGYKEGQLTRIGSNKYTPEKPNSENLWLRYPPALAGTQTTLNTLENLTS